MCVCVCVCVCLSVCLSIYVVCVFCMSPRIVLLTGKRGRPKLYINHEQLEFLRDMQLSWTEIARVFGISRMTLYTRRIELGLTENYSSISANALAQEVSSIKNDMPEAGEMMIQGVLHSRGIRVQRWKLRDAIHEMDLVNTPLRWRPRIQRRPYSVPGSNALWHLG